MEILTQVHIVCREHPRVLALEHVARLIDDFVDCRDAWTLPDAVKTRSIRLVGRVMASSSESLTRSDVRKCRQYKRATQFAAAMGDLDMIEKLREWASIPLDTYELVPAALNGSLQLLQWLNERGLRGFLDSFIGQMAFDVAAERGHFETVQWLVTTFPRAGWTLGPAALGGHLEMIKWLHQHANVNSEHRLEEHTSVLQKHYFSVSVEAFKKCNKKCEGIEAATWRFLGRSPTATDAMDWAARNNHVDVLEWLNANRSEGCSPAAVNMAAEAGNMEALLWLDEHYSQQWTAAAMDHAARGGKLEVVEWMHRHRREGCSMNAIDWAAKAGHLDVVKWLHKNVSVGCTTNAMDEAARSGILDVVQWLHENRAEGCTTRAMDQAAENDHLAVVQWLHDSRLEGCTTRAMDLAAQNGHLEMVQRLHTNRSEGCTTNAVDMAAFSGHLEVLQWLFANRTERGTAMALAYASDEHHEEVFRWLEEQDVDFPIPNDDDE